MTKTAILVDGGFYRKRAANLWGKKNARDRADELIGYAFKHLDKKDGPCARELYRIFYYDCPPLRTTVFHPLRGNIDFGKQETYQWSLDFFNELKRQRKVALRLGRLSDGNAHFAMKPDTVKRICAGKMTVEDLTEKDFAVSFVQKGVDMRMGIDISSLAYEGIVGQIILISGDSDFVPAAKAARRKGIDFILDPMGQKISDDLFEHIDGKETFIEEGDPQPRRKRKAKAPQSK